MSGSSRANLFSYIEDIDIVVREDLGILSPGTTWNYDRFNDPTILELDFYSVIKHELGHAHHLKHAIPDTKIMYWKLVAGETRRNFNIEDVNGGNAVIDESIAVLGPQGLCPDPMSRDAGLGLCLGVHTNEVDNKQRVLITPNPVSSDKIDILVDFNLTGEITIDIWDVTGSSIANYIVNVTDTDTNIQLELPKELERGSYFLRILQANKHILTEKFIKL